MLRKWTSNCNELLKSIHNYEQLHFNEVCAEKVHKVLGVAWDLDADVLTFDLSKILQVRFLWRS